MDTTEVPDVLKFLKTLKKKARSYPQFEESVQQLQLEASLTGLDDAKMKLLMDIIKHTPLGSNKLVELIKCMIPISCFKDIQVQDMIVWFISASSMEKLPVRVCITLVQWIIGCWEYQLVDREIIYIFYDSIFYNLLKQNKIESVLAQLIYIMTKPEDVTRRQVLRILKLCESRRRIPKHFAALLSLFKSYKPEVVPEKILAINVQSVWRPLPETMQASLEKARDRVVLNNNQNPNQQYINWAIFHSNNKRKKTDPILPSVSYLNTASNLSKDNISKTVFDITSHQELGKYHNAIKLPGNSTSLLANSIGYHLLMYADHDYQRRFMHNLYYTFRVSFILENSRFSDEEINRLLDMTIEFSNYMQHGISMVNYFTNEFLGFCLDQYQFKLLSLIQWSSSSVSELQDILNHLKLMFYRSSKNMKLEILRTLKYLKTNLCVTMNQRFQNKSFPFLGESYKNELPEILFVIENFAKDLIASALNINYYDTQILYEALSFYEQCDILKDHCDELFLTIAPSSVMYGSLVDPHCALLSNSCSLLLKYCNFKDHIHQKRIKWLTSYVEDYISALWKDDCFSNRFNSKRYFLKSITKELTDEYKMFNLNTLLNIDCHHSLLPYKLELRSHGILVKDKYNAIVMLEHLSPDIFLLISSFCQVSNDL